MARPEPCPPDPAFREWPTTGHRDSERRVQPGGSQPASANCSNRETGLGSWWEGTPPPDLAASIAVPQEGFRPPIWKRLSLDAADPAKASFACMAKPGIARTDLRAPAASFR